jgi:hypothetical protein
MVGNQDVLRLQVAMVDPNGMTILNGIQNLQEGMLGQLIVAHETALLGDVGEQVTLGTELNHDESAIRAVQNAEQRHNIGVLARLVVQSDLPSLKASLSGVQSNLWQGLHGVRDIAQDVDGLVNDSISTDSKDRDKFQSSG